VVQLLCETVSYQEKKHFPVAHDLSTRYLSKRNENTSLHKDLVSNVLGNFIIKTGNTPKCPSTGGEVNKL